MAAKAKRTLVIVLAVVLAFCLLFSACGNTASEVVPHAVEQPHEASAPAPYENQENEINVPLTDDLGVPVEIVPVAPAHPLLALWEREGYPDDIGGVYFDNDTGLLAFLLIDPTPERIAELQTLAGHDLLITPGTYSYNELRRIQNEIWYELIEDGIIYHAGVGWATDEDGNVTGFGESGKELRVIVGVDETVFEHYRDEFARRFGDRVFVEIGRPIGW